MRRSLVLLTAAAVVATPLAASAAPAKAGKRVVTFDYQGTEAGDAGGASFSLNSCATTSCFDLDTTKGERTITLNAVDATGRPVGLQVWVDDAYEDTVQVICGTGKLGVNPKTPHLVSIRPSASVGCGSVPTQGRITATVTNGR